MFKRTLFLLYAPRTIRNVVVVGGTHGNEYTGVWCIKALDRQATVLQQTYPSLDISTLLANPEAYMANKRFIEEDLNRQFSSHALSQSATTLEAKIARELNELLGPKPLHEGEDDHMNLGKTDVIIDMHSTTANMGVVLIVAEGDNLMAQAAAYAMQRCTQAVCLLSTIKSRPQRPSLTSLAKHGMTIEVGPVPQGLLRHDSVEKTQGALHAVLEFLHLHNQEPNNMQQRLYDLYPSRKVPCYRSALAFRGKISWPSAEDNPNFPRYMVHKNVQDKDFSLIREGDPLFVDLDGEVIPYDGSHGSPICVTFINEGGYYYASSGTGISVAKPACFDLESGRILRDDEVNSSDGTSFDL